MDRLPSLLGSGNKHHFDKRISQMRRLLLSRFGRTNPCPWGGIELEALTHSVRGYKVDPINCEKQSGFAGIDWQ